MEVVVVTLGFTRLHHCSQYVVRGVVTPSIIVSGTKYEFFRKLFSSFISEFGNSCSVVVDEFLRGLWSMIVMVFHRSLLVL